MIDNSYFGDDCSDLAAVVKDSSRTINQKVEISFVLPDKCREVLQDLSLLPVVGLLQNTCHYVQRFHT